MAKEEEKRKHKKKKNTIEKQINLFFAHLNFKKLISKMAINLWKRKGKEDKIND